ncbi:uncharacterized protein LOC120290565 [Eucalyptus grandis]|uniref:uncharacterized protein LOC120290565 n=1 Tax=Eucalyptus grandis TaxID=71139 RepID=UPI00192E8761|nr:uncharacterized protein LOC120290565 [Eucalyptus grandis]
MGDFNAIRDPYDRTGSSDTWIPCFDDFYHCLIQSELEDLRYVGFRFTWSTSSGVNHKARKIDQVLVNANWSQEFSYSEASFLAPGISNHTPMVVRVMQPMFTRRPFKFFEFWTKHPSFHSIVFQVWESPGEGVPMYRLVSKLKALKGRLKQLNKESYSNIFERVSAVRNALSLAQVGLQQDPTSEILADLEKTHRRTFLELRSQEESFFRQKSKIRWLKKGALGTSPPIFHPLLIGYSGEIHDTVFSLAQGKAPGPDGFGVEFFKHNWEIVGSLVIEAVKDFLTIGRLLREINNTILVLIPKVPNVTSVNDYRPIAYCNTIYKCITKILANRIAVVLSDIISPYQNAFVKGRRIRDKILLAQELFAGFHLDPYQPKCAIKVDFQKAYDMVDWDFLELVLRAFGFSDHFVQIVMRCFQFILGYFDVAPYKEEEASGQLGFLDRNNAISPRYRFNLGLSPRTAFLLRPCFCLMAGLRMRTWADNLHWALKFLPGKDFYHSIARFSFGALYHLIWKYRNEILFRNYTFTVPALKNHLIKAVKDKALTFTNVEDNPRNMRLQHTWGIDPCIFYSSSVLP